MSNSERTCEIVVASTTVAVALGLATLCHRAFGPWASWLALVPGLVLGFVAGAGLCALRTTARIMRRGGR